MQTLFIYDNSGKIFSYMTGTFDVPIGLQHLIEEIPENSFPIKVNVEGQFHFVEYGQHPRSKVEELEEIVAEQEAALIEIAEMLMMMQVGGDE